MAKFDRLLSDCERIGIASAKRLAAADHAEEVRAVSVLMLFEASSEAAPKSATGGRASRPGRRARTSR